jgi:hypothetical protein
VSLEAELRDVRAQLDELTLAKRQAERAAEGADEMLVSQRLAWATERAALRAAAEAAQTQAAAAQAAAAQALQAGRTTAEAEQTERLEELERTWAQERAVIARDAEAERTRSAQALRDKDAELERAIAAARAADTERARLAAAARDSEVERTRLATAVQEAQAELARTTAAARAAEGERVRLAAALEASDAERTRVESALRTVRLAQQTEAAQREEMAGLNAALDQERARTHAAAARADAADAERQRYVPLCRVGTLSGTCQRARVLYGVLS